MPPPVALNKSAYRSIFLDHGFVVDGLAVTHLPSIRILAVLATQRASAHEHGHSGARTIHGSVDVPRVHETDIAAFQRLDAVETVQADWRFESGQASHQRLADVVLGIPQHVSGRGTENMFRHQCPLSSAIPIIWENDMGKAKGTKPRAPSLRITVVSCGGFHLADCAVQSTTAPWWNVREITSSCCSLVSLTKFTA